MTFQSHFDMIVSGVDSYFDYCDRRLDRIVNLLQDKLTLFLYIVNYLFAFLKLDGKMLVTEKNRFHGNLSKKTEFLKT